MSLLAALVGWFGLFLCWRLSLTGWTTTLTALWTVAWSARLSLSSSAFGQRHRDLLSRVSRVCFFVVVVFIIFDVFVSGPSRGPAVEPGDRTNRVVNRLVPEEDLVKVAAWLLDVVGSPAISPSEHEGFVEALTLHYDRMAAVQDQGTWVRTPLIATQLDLQSPDAFDLVRFFRRYGYDRTAFVFLHGYGGNWAMLCWIAHEHFGATEWTFCPSTSVAGNWATTEGVATLATTLAEVPPESELYLFALSAGAASVDAAIDQLPADARRRIAGVIYLFGGESVPPRHRIPGLIVAGRGDERFSWRILKANADRQRASGRDLTFELVDADHFGLAKQHLAVSHAVNGWLSTRRANAKPNAPARTD